MLSTQIYFPIVGGTVWNWGPKFADPDGDVLTFSVSSSNTDVATVTLEDGWVYITRAVGAAANQDAVITITAEDGNGGIVSEEYRVRTG